MLMICGWLGAWKLCRKPLEQMMLVMRGWLANLENPLNTGDAWLGLCLEQMMLMMRDLSVSGNYAANTLEQMMLMMRGRPGVLKHSAQTSGSKRC